MMRIKADGAQVSGSRVEKCKPSPGMVKSLSMTGQARLNLRA